MKSRSFFQVDVFTARAGMGNPLAVVVDDGSLEPVQMQAIAAWTNLAETTFLLPPVDTSADYRVRIFTTRQEIAFAGHPSIGTAHAAIAAGLARHDKDVLVQECLGGLLPIRIEAGDGGTTLAVRVPRSRIVGRAASANPLLAEALHGVIRGRLQPALVEGGRRWWLAELQDEEQVRGMKPDHQAIRRLAEHDGSLGLCVFARCDGQAYDMVVRAFPLGVGINEDPASGAANAAIAAFLDEAGALAGLGNGYRVSQGREIDRDAQLLLRIDQDRQVWVGGRCVTVVRGTLEW